MGFKLSKSFGWSLARDSNPGGGVPESIVVDGVTYFLLRDDDTNKILRDDDTNQPLYDEAA